MKCSTCGGTYRLERYGKGSSTRKRMETDGICFHCAFWESQIDNPENVVIANGTHYRLGDGKGKFKGHSGRRFVIQFFNGSTHISNDLWSQGLIPERFRGRLPDNATLSS
jgi:hypothetical protein